MQTVQREEIIFLLFDYLRDEKERFPLTFDAFQREAADVVVLPRPAMKPLKIILSEYLLMRSEVLKRSMLKEKLIDDYAAAQTVKNVFENLVNLLEDYKAVRETFQSPSHLTANFSDDGNKTDRIEALKAKVPRNPGSSGPQKRPRKSKPMYHGRGTVSVNETLLNDCQSGKSVVVENQTGSDVSCMECPPDASDSQGQSFNDIHTIYSDISDSVLSDPQVSRMFQESSLEDLIGILEDDDSTNRLAAPITHHINALLSTAPAIPAPAPPPALPGADVPLPPRWQAAAAAAAATDGLAAVFPDDVDPQAFICAIHARRPPPPPPPPPPRGGM